MTTDPSRHLDRPPSLWATITHKPVQPELPLEGLPSMRRARLQGQLKAFATGFGPRLGSQLLMRFGVPMVGATTPMVVGMFAPDSKHDWALNLVVGSGLGGLWGAGVGALLPFGGAGTRIPRVRAAGMGAASGIVLAPAVAAVSKYVTDWVTSPLRDDEGSEGSA
jgi:hypothetical protein